MLCPGSSQPWTPSHHTPSPALHLDSPTFLHLFCLLPLSTCPNLHPACFLPLPPNTMTSLSQLRQLWRSRGSGRMRTIEEGDSATFMTSIRRSAGVGLGGKPVGAERLLGLRAGRGREGHSDGRSLTPSLCQPGVPSPTCGVWWSVAPAWSLRPSSSPARPSQRHQHVGRPGCWPGSSTTVSSTSMRPSRGAEDWSLSLSCILGQAGGWGDPCLND